MYSCGQIHNQIGEMQTTDASRGQSPVGPGQAPMTVLYNVCQYVVLNDFGQYVPKLQEFDRKLNTWPAYVHMGNPPPFFDYTNLNPISTDERTREKFAYRAKQNEMLVKERPFWKVRHTGWSLAISWTHSLENSLPFHCSHHVTTLAPAGCSTLR